MTMTMSSLMRVKLPSGPLSPCTPCRREAQGGFTLIELLIVIVILGILAAIVVFAVQNLASSSATASCGSDLKTVETAVEAYKAQEGFYPTATAVTGPPAIPVTFDAAVISNGVYALTQINTGANNGRGTAANPIGPWLSDIPFNAGHYEIQVATNGTGAIYVNQTPDIDGPRTHSCWCRL